MIRVSILYSLPKPIIECSYNGYMYIMTNGKYLYTSTKKLKVILS